MTTPTFAHRYGLAFTGQHETTEELRRQLVTEGAEKARYAELYGRLTTKHYRLLSAAEMFLSDRITREELAAVVGGMRK